MFKSTLASPEQSRSRSKSRDRRRELALTRSMQAAKANEIPAETSDAMSTQSSRRRNMGFLKYAPEKRSSVSMNRTREHAKQIAMVLSNDVSASSSFADFGSAFGSGDDPFADTPVASSRSVFPERHDAASFESTSHTNDDFFQMDLFSPDALQKHGQPPPQPTPPPPRSSRRGPDTGSNPNSATDWPVTVNAPVVRVSALTASPVIRKAAPTTRMMAQSHGTQAAAVAPSARMDNFADFTQVNETRPQHASPSKASTARMEEPTTPERRPPQSNSQPLSVSPVPSQTLSAGAAARRRVRTQMRRKEEPATNTAATKQITLSPPVKQGDSTGRGTMSVGKATNHVANYSVKQPQHRTAVAPPAAQSNGSATKELNLFDINTKHGFSFDAFGLDGAVMQREVTEAVNALAGCHPGLSMFLQDDDFVPAGRWDTGSINNSMNDSANISVTSSIPDDDEFVDGFRVTKAPGLPMYHVRESPTRSERSSLTSESLDHNVPNGNGNPSMNMFKQQAGFHASRPRKVVRPPHEAQMDMLPRKTTPVLHGRHGMKPPTGSRLDAASHELPEIPILDENRPDTDETASRRKHEHNVEFYGEESSADEDFHRIEAAPLHVRGDGSPLAPYSLHGRPGSDVGTDFEPTSDAGVASDPEFASDVGVSSQVGAPSSDIGMLPYMVVGKDKVRSSSVRTESTAATTAVEEKKDDDDYVRPQKSVGNLRSKWETREAEVLTNTEQKRLERQHVPSSLSKEHISRLQDQLGEDLLSPEKLLSPKNGARLNSFDEVETRHSDYSIQKQRSNECNDQRKSFVSVKERLRTTVVSRPDEQSPYKKETSAKSEGGAAVRAGNVSSFLTNLEKKTSPMGNSSKSDCGSPSAASFAVKLRKTGIIPGVSSAFPRTSPVSPHFKFGNQPASPNKSGSTTPRSHQEAPQKQFESQAMRLARQQSESPSNGRLLNSPSMSNRGPREMWSNRKSHEASHATKSPRSDPRTAEASQAPENDDKQETYEQEDATPPVRSPKQLTYRERRELELKKMKEDEAARVGKSKPPEATERDVASLIKQRIAANKKTAAVAAASSYDSVEEKHDNIATLRQRLKPTSSHCSNDEDDNKEMEQSRANRDSVYGAAPETQSYHDNRPLGSPRRSNPRSPGRGHYESNDYSEPNVVQPQSRDVESPHQMSHLNSPNSGYGGNTSPRHANADFMRSSAPQSSGRRKSDLVIETETAEPPPEKAVASSAVSHMLMLQQLQQRQPHDSKAPGKADKDGILGKVALAKSPTAAAGSDAGTEEQISRTPKATMMMLNAFLAGREAVTGADGNAAPPLARERSEDESTDQARSSALSPSTNGLPALKDDPKYARYFKMLAVGMPMDVVKHAMTRDNLDPSVMDNDHNKPVGIPLKSDQTYSKYFKMLSIGLPMEAVKHAMERDGLDSALMDQDHDLPAATGKGFSSEEPKEKDSHRRARLHWKTLRKVTSNSLWAQIDQDADLNIEIDEQEFQELFQAERTEAAAAAGTATASSQKRSSTVCVIDAKRANNGGIILARLKMSHDDMAEAVDRIDEQELTAEQIENVIEYLPTKDERKALESYMLEGGQDAAEKFEGLCECEKFMVSMMTVKHAKRKVSALLFKLQFESCIRDIQKEACAIEQACEELSSSVRLRQLLGIVLTFGNRLNTAGNGKRKAGAFTLDSLLKLNQAKAFDKKTTFLHYIILIVQRNNELLLNFKDDLPTVFASDKIFWDQCVADLEEVENQLENVRKIALYQAHQAQSYRLRRKSKRDDPDESLSDAEEALTLEEEVEALRSTPIGLFTLSAIKYVSALRDKIEGTKVMFARILEYFGEEEKQLQPHELFNIIVSFSRDFDKAKEQVLTNEKLKQREERKRLATSNMGRAHQSGKPPSASPTPSGKKQNATLKASNMQPNMSHVMSEFKSSPSQSVNSNQQFGSPVRQATPHQRELEPNHSTVPVQHRGSPVRDTRASQRVALLPEHTVETNMYPKSPMAAPITAVDEDNEVEERESSQTRPPSSTQPSTSAVAVRARARMRRQRGRMSPSSVDMSSQPAESAHDGAEHMSERLGTRDDQAHQAAASNGLTHQSPMSPAPAVTYRNIARTASDDSGAQPIDPRSSIRMKRRMEHRMGSRRSVDSSAQ